MCTEFQKKIYNEQLKRLRLAKKQPYQIRKNFTDLSDSAKLCLLKLESLFISNPYIKYTDFLDAPYKIYGENEVFDLKFYCSQKAMSIYSLYIKNIMESDPDSILDRIVNGIKFIEDFCLKNNISVLDYSNHMTGLYPTFFLHLKNFIYPLYVIFFLPKARESFEKISPDEKNFLFSNNVYGNINELYRKVNASLNARRVLEAWIKKQYN